MKKYKQSAVAVALLAILGANAPAQTPVFTPGQLAVLQLGTGGPGRCLPLGAITGITNYSADDIAGSRQTPLFIDQYDPNGVNQTNNYFVQVAIATNGPTAMLINGNAGTEGGMTLSANKRVLTFGGYQGDILSITTGGQTAPSNLSYDRGIGTVDAFGNYENPYRGADWYGIATGKTNPRGVATDGEGNFWGCGNGYGSLYFGISSGFGVIQFQNVALTSFSKVINSTLYASVKQSEAVNLYPAGVYSFVDFYNNPVKYPTSASFLHLEIPAAAPFTTCIGFDINPQNNVAYLADTTFGIQKYIKVGLNWKIAYNLAIPGYLDRNSGIMTNNVINYPGNTNVLVGAFSITVDWSGTNPVIYATTSDTAWKGNPYYGNRVIRINDTNTVVIGTNSIIATTNILTTVVHPWADNNGQLTNVVFKSVTFTPSLLPVIVTNPVSWSAVVGDNLSFSVVATSSTATNYQWQQNGANLPGETNPTLNVSSVGLGLNNTDFKCVVGNNYGAVTSSIATLTVSSAAIPPVLGAVQNLTNNVGNNQSITAVVSGTDPKGGYQWYFNGVPLSDSGEFSGTQTGTLTITQASTADSGAYSVTVTNIGGSANSVVANFTAVYALPVFVQTPASSITFFGRNFTNNTSVYGLSLSYQWFTSKANGTGMSPLSDSGVFSGTTTPSLAITGANAGSATNYVIVVSNPAGSITSSPVALQVQIAPAHTFVSYTNINQNYVQGFNSLPNIYGTSAEGNNPLSPQFVVTNLAIMLTNGNPGVTASYAVPFTYSVDNPVDFGYPIITNGFLGGWGLSNSMAGWYGWCQKSMVIAITRGDQSQGAIVDNGGNYTADGSPLSGITNRSLGLIATTKTGPNAIGIALINKTTNTLNTVNLSYTGELWRNNPNQQPLLFGYYIDPAGTNSTLHPDLWDATNGITYVPSLNVVFPTTPLTTINDGTQSSNQVSLSASGLVISNWPPNATLWLVWQAQTLGTSQNVAIDNVSFSATPAQVVVTTPTLGGVTYTGAGSGSGSGPGLQFSFTNTPGASWQFTVWGTTNLALPFSQWQNLGNPAENPPGTYNFVDPLATNQPQKYYQVKGFTP